MTKLVYPTTSLLLPLLAGLRLLHRRQPPSIVATSVELTLLTSSGIYIYRHFSLRQQTRLTGEGDYTLLSDDAVKAKHYRHGLER